MLTTKILKENEEDIYQLTYCELTTTKVSNAAHVLWRIEFNVSIMDCYGPETALDDFPDLAIPNTPKLNLLTTLTLKAGTKSG